MAEVKIERVDFTTRKPSVSITDTSSGTAVLQSKSVRRVIVSSPPKSNTNDLYSINKRLNKEYTVTSNSSSESTNVD